MGEQRWLIEGVCVCVCERAHACVCVREGERPVGCTRLCWHHLSTGTRTWPSAAMREYRSSPHMKTYTFNSALTFLVLPKVFILNTEWSDHSALKESRLQDFDILNIKYCPRFCILDANTTYLFFATGASDLEHCFDKVAARKQRQPLLHDHHCLLYIGQDEWLWNKRVEETKLFLMTKSTKTYY